MQGDLTPESPTAEADESPAVSSEESAHPSSEPEVSPDAVAHMNAMIRGGVDSVASKPDETAEDDDPDSEPGGESASSEGVKPSDAPASGKGRRGAAAEIARLAAENARLQQTLDTIAPKPPDPSEEARTAAIAKEQRFRRLLMKPDTDQDWDADDWHFLQTEKTERALVPKLVQHYDTVIAEDLKAHEAAYDGKYQGFQNYVLQGMEAVKGLPGVNFEAIQAAPDFVARERLIYAAGAASKEAEAKLLRDENAELKRDLYGATRAPLNGGRSSPGRTYSANDTMNNLIRGGRA